jgi:hypothetical protein
LNEQATNKVFRAKILENTQKSGFRKKRWLLLIDAAATLIILLITAILIHHKPADYNPQPVSDKQLSTYLTNQLLPQFYNGMQRNEPFELVIEQKGLNEAITSFGWPQIHNDLIISTPAVAFSPQGLRLMTMVNYNSVNMVVTVEVVPRFDDKGRLNLEVDKAKVGALGVTFVAKKLAKKMFDEQVQVVEPDNIVSLVLASMLADRPFEPVFEVEGKKAKVDNIVLEKSALRLHIVPVRKTR